MVGFTARDEIVFNYKNRDFSIGIKDYVAQQDKPVNFKSSEITRKTNNGVYRFFVANKSESYSTLSQEVSYQQGKIVS